MSRESRLTNLQSAVQDYIRSEKTRIQNEVKVLEDILKGRTAGAGIQTNSVAVVQAVAESDLAAYLSGS